MRRRALLLRVLTAIRSAVNTSSDLPCSTKISNLGVSPTNRVTRVIFLMKPMTAVKPPQECNTLQRSDTTRLLRLNHMHAHRVVSLFGLVGRKVAVWLFVVIMQVTPRRNLQTSHVFSNFPAHSNQFHAVPNFIHQGPQGESYTVISNSRTKHCTACIQPSIVIIPGTQRSTIRSSSKPRTRHEIELSK